MKSSMKPIGGAPIKTIGGYKNKLLGGSVKPPGKGDVLSQSLPQPDEDYQAQGHLRTLMDAEMIKANPEHMKAVHKLAGRHKKAIKNIQDIKDAYHSLNAQPEEPGEVD